MTGNLRRLFGDSPTAKIVGFFLNEPVIDYTKKNVSELSGVCWKTTNKVILKLEKLGLVVFSRRINKAMLYRANFDPQTYRNLKRIDDTEFKSDGV